jgi:hypothetical protein
METEFKTPQLETTTESLKLIKNTKGYNWEIKLLSLDIEKLTELNNEMIARFGSGSLTDE